MAQAQSAVWFPIWGDMAVQPVCTLVCVHYILLWPPVLCISNSITHNWSESIWQSCCVHPFHGNHNKAPVQDMDLDEVLRHGSCSATALAGEDFPPSPTHNQPTLMGRWGAKATSQLQPQNS